MLAAMTFALWSYFQELPTWLAVKTFHSGRSVAASFHGLNKHSVTVDGCSVAYLETGQGPTLVMLHGLGVSKEIWLPLVAELKQQYRLIIPDLPGHGESCRGLDRDYRIPAISQWLKAFLDQLGTGTVHLTGSSLGGSTAAWFAADHPDMVRSLFLLAPAGIEPTPHLSDYMNELVTSGHNRLVIEDTSQFEDVLSLVMHRRPWIPAPARYLMALDHVQNRPVLNKIMAGLLATRKMVLNGSPSMQDIVNRIQAPVRVIWGEMDKVMDVSHAKTLQEYRPDGELIILPDVGHVPMVEDPSTVARLLEEHVEGIEFNIMNDETIPFRGFVEREMALEDIDPASTDVEAGHEVLRLPVDAAEHLHQ